MNEMIDTEIGFLPKDWKVEKLNKHLLIKGRLGWKGLKVSEYQSTGRYIISGLQIKPEGIAWQECARISDERYNESPEIMLENDDILMTKDGTIGKLGIIKNLTEKATVASHIHVIRKKTKDINSDFLFYFFKSPLFDRLIKSKISGSVIPALTQEDINNTLFPLPTLTEQKNISQLFLSLDAMISNLREQNQVLENITQTLFIHWFIDFEFPDSNGNPYKSTGGKIIDTEMGKIPKGWKIGSFGSIAETVGGGTPSTDEESYWQDGDIQWYSPTDLTKSNHLFSLSSGNKISRLGLQKSSAKLFPPHSIMLTSRATVGEISINSGEASTNQGFITIIPNSRFTLPFLLGYVKYNLPIVKSLASGSTFPEISKTNFRSIGLFIPTDEIINTFTKASMPLLMKIESNIKTIQKLDNFKEILLPKLMSGQLRIK